jgi:RHS repeat-associated protein
VNPTPNVAFAYDPYFPRVTMMTDGTGTTSYTYVPVGPLGALRVQQETGPLPNGAIAYGYDALGRLAARTVGGAPAESFQYDAIGRLVGHTDALGQFAIGYLGETTQPTSRGVSGIRLATAWSYQPNSGDRRLLGINNATARQYSYGTTPENLITWINEETTSGSLLQGWTFGYDNDYRLLSGVSTTLATYGYTPDPAGNIIKLAQPSGSTSLTYNSVNEVIAAGAQPFAYDANGNLVSDGARNYAWDAENRLVGITYAAQPGKKTTFAYDGLDRRVAIATTAAGTTTTADYIWCASRICQSRNGASTVNRLYYDEGEAIPASQALFYYGPDQLGSVRDVYAASPLFSMVQSYNYDPHGNPTLTPSTGPLTDFRYAGMLYHADSGLYLTQYRAYDPRTAHWLSRDPIGLAGGINPYVYVDGNPLSFTDTQGEQLVLAACTLAEDTPLGSLCTIRDVEEWINNAVACFRGANEGRYVYYNPLKYCPYQAKAGCATSTGSRRTRLAPLGIVPDLSWS